jgi:murein DD-endopeptidase MepM/ murein hydrolase activator NlpD
MSIEKFQSIIKKIESASVFVLDASIPKRDYVGLDLSKNNAALQMIDVSSSADIDGYIKQHLKNKNGKVAYGGYLETRGLYQRSTYFKQQSSSLTERNIHLGLDLWTVAGTSVLSALDGEIHSFKNNLNHGDYGPTLILKHQIADFIFYTLYGHLSLASLSGLKIGKKIKQGEMIAQLGTAEVNGDYSPHLHFQCILDIANFSGDYPGVSSIETLAFYQNNCPNPNFLLGLDSLTK